MLKINFSETKILTLVALFLLRFERDVFVDNYFPRTFQFPLGIKHWKVQLN
jgi:hypothetical protein